MKNSKAKCVAHRIGLEETPQVITQANDKGVEITNSAGEEDTRPELPNGVLNVGQGVYHALAYLQCFAPSINAAKKALADTVSKGLSIEAHGRPSLQDENMRYCFGISLR